MSADLAEYACPGCMVSIGSELSERVPLSGPGSVWKCQACREAWVKDDLIELKPPAELRVPSRPRFVFAKFLAAGIVTAVAARFILATALDRPRHAESFDHVVLSGTHVSETFSSSSSSSTVFGGDDVTGKIICIDARSNRFVIYPPDTGVCE